MLKRFLTVIALIGTFQLNLVAQSDLAAWKLVWSDEFNGPAGTTVDPQKWTAETGGSGWGNKEQEFYTAGSHNAALDGAGNLIITASKEPAHTYKCRFGPGEYSSARLITKGKFAQKYGRIEARIQIPRGQGMWPAFWMLGNDVDSEAGDWPQCGEIDIMENIGKEPAAIHGTMHGPGYSDDHGPTAVYTLPEGKKFADDFHTFAIEWEPNEIRWYVDGNLYERRTAAELPKGKKWVFDHPFFILLNVAVGGDWPGNPDGSTSFPQTMKVDYVRVYQK